MTTFPPDSANAIAVDLPMPEVPPVTRMTLLVKEKFMTRFLLSRLLNRYGRRFVHYGFSSLSSQLTFNPSYWALRFFCMNRRNGCPSGNLTSRFYTVFRCSLVLYSAGEVRCLVLAKFRPYD